MKAHYEINVVDDRLWGIWGVLASYGPRELRWFTKNKYVLKDAGDRHRMMNELRQNIHAKGDEDIKYYKVKLRGRRMCIPTKWDDEHIGKWGGKSWKLGTKCRKQYMKNIG